jgi:hypothetical protein
MNAYNCNLPVIPALGAGIHALGRQESKAWIPGLSPGMTSLNSLG